MPRLTPDQRDTSIEQEGSCAQSNTLRLSPSSAHAGNTFVSVGSMCQSQKTCSRAEQQSTALTSHAVEID